MGFWGLLTSYYPAENKTPSCSTCAYPRSRREKWARSAKKRAGSQPPCPCYFFCYIAEYISVLQWLKLVNAQSVTRTYNQ